MGRKTYAHANSAVIAAADNPLNHRYSIVVVAGLSAEATVHAAPLVMRRAEATGAEVIVIPNQGKPQYLVVPPRDLVIEFTSPSIQARSPSAAALTK